MTKRCRRDDGSVMILMIFFAVIVAGLVTVIVDASTVFLAQREMQSTADGAALAAVQHADLPTVYGGTLGDQLPLSSAEVQAVAAAYSTAPARIPHECAASSYQLVGAQSGGGGNAATGLQPDGQTVRVELTCKVPLPFVSLVAGAFTDGVTIREVASARSAVSPVAP
jgi:Flp pilus assembly protein TadG